MTGTATAALALSFGPGVSPAERQRLVLTGAHAVALRADQAVSRLVDRDDLCVLVATTPPDHRPTLGDGRSLPLGHAVPAWHDVHLPPSATLSMDDDTLSMSVDAVGLRRGYHTSASGWAAVSSSSLVLGALRGGHLDEATWGAAALLGFPIGDGALFAGVHRIPAGHSARLRGGGVTMSPCVLSPAENHDGAAAIRTAVRTCLEAFPDAAIELSGGLDSRIVLAAIPAADRAGRTAVTIGGEGDPDAVVARSIAAGAGLDHRVLVPLELEPGEDLLARALLAGRRREHASDALAAAVLDDVERRAPQGPRLTGVNGEFVRGFYYPGLGRGEAITRARVERLARWRMFANHRAAPSLFRDDWLEEQEHRVIDRVTEHLQRSGRPWHEATDEYYLEERVPNWAGPGYSHAATQRTVLAPFLHPAFLAWARTTSPRQRAGSRAMAGILAALDPGLARVPLAGGPRPTLLIRGGPGAAAAKATRFSRKAARKVRQRIRNERRPTTGATLLVAPIAAALRRLDLSGELGGFDFLRVPLLPEGAAGQTMDQPTASYLVNVLGVARYLAAVERAVGQGSPAADSASAPASAEDR